MTTRLSERPHVHPSATVTGSTLGRYTEVGAGCTIAHATLGDYSYCVEHTQIAYADIGKFANIASHVRIYASMHPMERASLHHFTYRSSWYFEGRDDDPAFFAGRAGQSIVIGHDTWIGHGAVIMPGVTIGNGAIIGSNAVVTRDVPSYSVAAGVPARQIRWRFEPSVIARLEALAWWDWDHDRLARALPDFRTMGVETFLDHYERGPPDR